MYEGPGPITFSCSGPPRKNPLMKIHCEARIAILLLLTLTALTASAQRGARTVGRSLDQLTRESDTIVHASVVSARVEPHPQLGNLMTVVVDLRVMDTLKGSTARTLEFRQYIWDIRDQYDAAGYRKGDEMVLMLGPTSQYGLRSPVGLEQGRFRVVTDRAGKKTAENGRGNVGLFASTESSMKAQGVKLPTATARLVHQQPHGPIPLSDLKDAIKSFSGVTR